MAASFNRVILVGNLTREPVSRYLQAIGTTVSDIGLAVNDRRKTPNGEWVDEVTFIDITFWGRTAEVVAEFCSKGSPLLVEGRLKLDTWEAEGQKRSKLKVIGEKIQLLSASGGSKGGATGTFRMPPSQTQSYDDIAPMNDASPNDAPGDAENIPF